MRDSDLTRTKAKGQKVELSGMVHLAIKEGGIKTWSKLYIAPDLDRTMILGEDWLKTNRAQINFNQNQLKIKGLEIPLASEARGKINIYTVDNIQLPPHIVVSCTARLGLTEQPKETLYQVNLTEEVIPGDEEVILVESVVRKNGKGKIPVMLANLGNKTVKAPKEENLGKALNVLFGTVSEEELDVIRSRLSAFEKDQ